MTCLACGLPTAAATHGAAHDLADALCLACLVEALQAGPQQAAAGSGVEPLTLKRRRCFGLRRTCPEPVAAHYLNTSWCDRHRPPGRAAPEPFTPTDPTDVGPEFAEALRALSGLGTVLYVTKTREPLEGT